MKNENSSSSAQATFTDCPGNADKHPKKKGAQIPKKKPRRNKRATPIKQCQQKKLIKMDLMAIRKPPFSPSTEQEK